MVEVDSTNRVALDLAREGAPEGVVVVADHQTAGRGRHGRAWEAAPGAGLLVSVLLRPTDLPPPRRHLAMALVALAARDALGAAAGFWPDVKWPNDLVVGDLKLAGVAAEAEGSAVVVGVGVNVAAWAIWPEGAVAAEAVAHRAVDPHELLAGLLASAAARYGHWDTVATDYRRACATVGRTVRVTMADETFTGAAADVTDDGHLLVDVGMCLREVVAGEVVHLRPY
ncbi:MAG TPA: biotin--[acetyl-CoA-carboxylase] ligase [Acidimicrobiales bacterium]|nr:biotin--[acetyl-CoA-carboxylase] ligase [Acidimicrobiales bacterium]